MVIKNLHKILSHLVSFLYGNVIVGKKINNIKADKTLFYEKSKHLNFLFEKRISYESILQEKIKKYIHVGDLIFDIGANIGQYAILFSDLIGESGRVISFEPDYKNFSFLQFNKTINNCNNLTCLNLGLGTEKATLDFFRDSTTGGRKGSFIKKNVGKNYLGESYKVEIETLSNVIDIYGIPRFVKIDVEGFEVEILKGLKTFPSDTIFLIETRQETKKDVFKFFGDSYNCFYIDELADLLIITEENIPSFANLLFIPKN